MAITNFGDSANVSGITTQNIVAGVRVGTINFSAGNANVFRTINTTFQGITCIQDGVGGTPAITSNSNMAATSSNYLRFNAGTLSLGDDLFVSNTGASVNAVGAIQLISAIAGSGNITFSNASTAIFQTGSIFLQSTKETFMGSVLVQKGITCVAYGTEFGGNAITLGENGEGSAALIGNPISFPMSNNTTVTGRGCTLTLGSLSTSGSVTFTATVTLNGYLILASSVPTGAGMDYETRHNSNAYSRR